MDGTAFTSTKTKESTADTAPDFFQALVVYEQNAHGAMTMRNLQTNATYQIVDYASRDLRQQAASLDQGMKTTLRVSRTGERGNLWRVEQLSELND